MSPLAVIDAPPARPPRYGLIASAEVVEDLTSRWEGGFTFAPEGCGNSGRASTPCAGTTDSLDSAAGNPPVVEGEPFVVWAKDECSTFGFNARDYAGRARRQLEATQSFQVAQELWEGTLASADGLPNRALVDSGSDTVTTAPTGLQTALACLEQGLAQCGQGRRGMIHLTPQLLTHLVGAQIGFREGNQVVTALGTLLVADAGYSGSGPGGVPATTAQWMYATSLIQIRLSAIDLIPGNFTEAMDRARAVDRRTNRVRLYAERLAAYAWDECCHLAAEVDIPACAIGGAS